MRDTSAFDVQYHRFETGVNITHLVVVTNYGDESMPTPPCSVYKWVDAQQTLVFHQHLNGNKDTLLYAGKASFLQIHDVGLFLSVAITRNSTSYETNSLIYQWDFSQLQFTLMQQVPTSAAIAIQGLNHLSRSYLLFANHFEFESRVYHLGHDFDFLGGNQPACTKRFLVWKVRELEGYGRLGHTMVSCAAEDGSCQPTEAYQIRLGSWLRRPKHYAIILPNFAASSQGGQKTLSLWRPVAPKGFICLGDVAHDSAQQPPSMEEVYCVRKDLLERRVRPAISS